MKMIPHRNEWIVIGISGVTCGGKTTLSNKLFATVEDCYVLHQDKYFLPDDHPRHVRVPDLEPPHNNYDILDALDMAQMYKDAVATIDGSSRMEGSFPLGGGRARVPNRRILICEGFTALNYKPLYDLCDFRYYFVLEYGECFSRRVHRLYDPPDVAGYFELCVWPEHLRYRAELEYDPNIKIVDGTRTDTYDMVFRDLREYGLIELPEAKVE